MSQRAIFLILFLSLQLGGIYSLDLDRMQAHLKEKIFQAKIEMDPFPHLIIENILPEDIYDELLSNWPSKIFFTNEIKDVIRFDQINNNSRAAWEQFSCFIDQFLTREISNLFRPYSFYRFGHDVSGMQLRNGLDHRLTQNFHSPSAHIDQGYIYAALFIYFPKRNETHKELGTRIYRHKQGRTCPTYCNESLTNVELVKTVPYKPNTLFAFLETPYAWHGSENPRSRLRRLYMSTIFFSTQFMKDYYGHAFGLDDNVVEEDIY